MILRDHIFVFLMETFKFKFISPIVTMELYIIFLLFKNSVSITFEFQQVHKPSHRKEILRNDQILRRKLKDHLKLKLKV